jgi:hypothetical protein
MHISFDLTVLLLLFLAIDGRLEIHFQLISCKQMEVGSVLLPDVGKYINYSLGKESILHCLQ